MRNHSSLYKSSLLPASANQSGTRGRAEIRAPNHRFNWFAPRRQTRPFRYNFRSPWPRILFNFYQNQPLRTPIWLLFGKNSSLKAKNQIRPCFREIAVKSTFLGTHQMQNAAMALAVCRTLIGSKSDCLSPKEVTGLKFTSWPGRSQICTLGARTVYLDGAHTVGKFWRLSKKVKKFIFHAWNFFFEKDYR